MTCLSRMSEAWTTDVRLDAKAFGMKGGPGSGATSNAHVRKTNACESEEAFVVPGGKYPVERAEWGLEGEFGCVPTT